MSFRVIPLPAERFAALNTLTEHELAERGIEIHVADARPGYPCRVSLRDAEPGERLFLLNHTHHDVRGPYRSCHAIFVREKGKSAALNSGEVPEAIRARPQLSVRAFSEDGTLRDAEVSDGSRAETVFERLLADESVAYLHVHTAARGCYLARVERC